MVNKSNKKTDKEGGSQFSITTVTIGVVIVIAIFGWGAMASAYAQSGHFTLDDGGVGEVSAAAGGIWFMIGGLVWFFWNIFAQIPNFVDVLKYSLNNQLSLLFGIALLEILAIAGGFGLKFAEGHLEDPYRKQRESRDDVRERVGIGAAGSDRPKKKKAKRRRPPE